MHRLYSLTELKEKYPFEPPQVTNKLKYIVYITHFVLIFSDNQIFISNSLSPKCKPVRWTGVYWTS